MLDRSLMSAPKRSQTETRKETTKICADGSKPKSWRVPKLCRSPPERPPPKKVTPSWPSTTAKDPLSRTNRLSSTLTLLRERCNYPGMCSSIKHPNKPEISSNFHAHPKTSAPLMSKLSGTLTRLQLLANSPSSLVLPSSRFPTRLNSCWTSRLRLTSSYRWLFMKSRTPMCLVNSTQSCVTRVAPKNP